MKTLILKHRQWSIKKPTSIYDKEGSLEFEVMQELPRKWTSTKTIFKLMNVEGKHSLSLSSEGISQVPSLRYSVIESDVKIGEVVGKKLFTHSEFDMTFYQGRYKLYGSKKFLFFEVQFEITKGNYNIAKITKKWYNKTYQIDIKDEKETVPILCLVILLSHLLSIRQGSEG